MKTFLLVSLMMGFSVAGFADSHFRTTYGQDLPGWSNNRWEVEKNCKEQGDQIRKNLNDSLVNLAIAREQVKMRVAVYGYCRAYGPSYPAGPRCEFVFQCRYDLKSDNLKVGFRLVTGPTESGEDHDDRCSLDQRNIASNAGIFHTDIDEWSVFFQKKCKAWGVEVGKM